MNEHNNGWIRTYTGRKIFPLDPRPEDIDIIDIAHALANTCRYTGHCRKFYSVAQHSVLVSHFCDEPLWGLLHDAPEAYLADIARPVKGFLPEFKEAENRLMAVIAEKFGLTMPEPPNVKDIDTRILVDEMHALMPCPEDGDHLGVPLGVAIYPMPPEMARSFFMNRYAALTTKKAVI